jgi:hypothetical protein
LNYSSWSRHILTARNAVTFAITVIAASCIDPFQPELKPGVLDMLTVDGFINATSNSALVVISRVQATDDFSEPTFEAGAEVSIGSSDGRTFKLTQEEPGRYRIQNMNLSFDAAYRLSIRTTSGREIRSDEIQLYRTPPIDSVTWRLNNDEEGISIMVATHNDDVSGSRRYAWNFIETYEYTAKYYSGFKKVNYMPVPRLDFERFRTDLQVLGYGKFPAYHHWEFTGPCSKQDHRL